MNNVACEAIVQSTGGIKKRCDIPKMAPQMGGPAAPRYCARHSKCADKHYEGAVKTLADNGLRLVYGRADFANTSTPVSVVCARGHTTVVRVMDMYKAANNKRVLDACVKCRRGTDDTELARAKAKLTELGHQFVASEPLDGSHHRITYACKCGKNGAPITTTTSSILGARYDWGGCVRCSQERSGAKQALEEVAARFEEAGCLLLATEYKDNKTNMPYVCACGAEAEITYHAFDAGHRCKACAPERYGDTCESKYGEGVRNAFQAPEVKEKIKQVNMEKRGVAYPMQSEEVRAKRDKTVEEKCGVKHAFHTKDAMEKSQQSMEDMYKAGAYQASENGRLLCQANHGTDNVMQVAEIHEKAMKTAHRFKPYTMPDGRVVHIQGYEDRAIDWLIKTYGADRVLVDRHNMPTIWYQCRGATHRYYPDIYVKPEDDMPGVIVEVKSVYTASCDLYTLKHKMFYSSTGDEMRAMVLIFNKNDLKEPSHVIMEVSELETMEDEYAPIENNQELIERNEMMYDEYVSYVGELTDNDHGKEEMVNGSSETKEKQLAKILTTTIPATATATAINIGALRVAFSRVEAGECDENSLKVFPANVLKEFAVERGAQVGTKQNRTKDDLIKRIMHPEFYAEIKQERPKFIYEIKMDMVKEVGHTNVRWENPEIVYTCKDCGIEQRTSCHRVTDKWRGCNSCSMKRLNQTMNRIINKSRPQNQPNPPKLKHPKSPKSYELKIKHIEQRGHTNVRYQSPDILYTCKDCGTDRKTRAENITEQWHTCRNCCTRERATDMAKKSSEARAKH